MGKSHEKTRKESQGKEEKSVRKNKLEKREHESCIREADLDVNRNIEMNDTIKQKPKKSKKSRKDKSVKEKFISETQANFDEVFLDAKSKTKKRCKHKMNVNCVSSLECADIDEIQFLENNNPDKTSENNVQHINTAESELCGEQSEDKRKKRKHKKDKSSDQSIETPCVEEMPVFIKRKRSRSEELEQIQSSGSEKGIHIRSEMPLGEDCSDYKARKSGRKKKKKHSKGDKNKEHEECAESVGEKDIEQEIKASKQKTKKLKKAKKESDLHVSDNELTLIDASGSEIVCEKVETIKKKEHKGLSSKGKMENSAICIHSTYTPENDQKSSQQKSGICKVDEMVGKVNSKDLVNHQTDGFGQWNTHMFENSERQNKFLRLLGGFKKSGALGTCTSESTITQKKGLFGSLKPAESQIGGSKAATFQQASDMNSRLETDFTTALSYSLGGQRGKGLGFQPDPAAGKKLYIDVNKCSSKKFDD